MTRLHGGSHLQQGTAHTPGNTTGAFLSDGEIAAAEARVREQEAHVLRLIVQGAPTQVAEDVLRQLTAAAQAIKERKRLAGR